jgi:predicted DNA-binding protein (MmcQ/YjbR family)
MAAHREVPVEIVDELRAICRTLPETHEQEAWTGTRWRVGNQTFAHVVMIANGWPPRYARAVGSSGPVVVLTFQASGDELEALHNLGHPYFSPGWRPGIVGMIVDDDVDWVEVAELLMESYCLLAPKRLVARVARPPDGALEER